MRLVRESCLLGGIHGCRDNFQCTRSTMSVEGDSVSDDTKTGDNPPFDSGEFRNPNWLIYIFRCDGSDFCMVFGIRAVLGNCDQNLYTFGA
jgi:hypothetical protein